MPVDPAVSNAYDNTKKRDMLSLNERSEFRDSYTGPLNE